MQVCNAIHSLLRTLYVTSNILIFHSSNLGAPTGASDEFTTRGRAPNHTLGVHLAIQLSALNCAAACSPPPALQTSANVQPSHTQLHKPKCACT